MKLITFEDIRNLRIPATEYYNWIDFVLRNRDKFVMPTKVRIPLVESDYCNLMPCSMPDNHFFGLKVINRSEKRRELGYQNLDSQILLYDYDTADLKAIMDGNYITTIRTAAVAVHSVKNFADGYRTIAMIGLGNIGIAIGDILFEMDKDKSFTVKLFKYKDHAERFIKRFEKYKNIRFVVSENIDDLMSDSDLVISSVTYAENDFCDPSVYKKGCTIIPVHMRGFMECDLVFDNIVVSDMVRAKGFKYFDQYKKVTLTDDILAGNEVIRQYPDDRVLIYNLGLAITDLYYAHKIYELIEKGDIQDFGPKAHFYM